jgi:Pyridoxamine 5'-phosphate oxidase
VLSISDKECEWCKLLIITPEAAKKVRNLRGKPNVYFSVDDENFHIRVSKANGTAAVIEDPERPFL